jgi:hypothetical protein
LWGRRLRSARWSDRAAQSSAGILFCGKLSSCNPLRPAPVHWQQPETEQRYSGILRRRKLCNPDPYRFTQINCLKLESVTNLTDQGTLSLEPELVFLQANFDRSQTCQIPESTSEFWVLIQFNWTHH